MRLPNSDRSESVSKGGPHGGNEMEGALPRKSVISVERGPLLGVADQEIARAIARQVERVAKTNHVAFASTLAELQQLARRLAPAVVLLDCDLLQGAAPGEFLRQSALTVPVIVLGPLAMQVEIAPLVAGGDVEFVARAGDFVPLAASLLERRLRWAAMSESLLGPPWAQAPGDMGAIFRHEINNPLTGILGNAELVLAHREHFSAAETQRLQTVVDLAVRLRETIRRISNAWENARQNLKSA